MYYLEMSLELPAKPLNLCAQATRLIRFCALCGLIVVFLLISPIRASARPAYRANRQQNAARGPNPSPTITLAEAEDLLKLLPVVKELRAKGMELKWDVQDVPTMNNKDYYFFWIYNVTAQKASNTDDISVGDFAVNRHTVDVRVWRVSQDVSYGDDGVLVTSNELERLQNELRIKHGIGATQISEYRPAHLTGRIIPRALAQSAVRLPVTERSSDTAGVSCWKDDGHLISRMGRSPTLSSSSGFRAYAEVEATAFRPKYQETYTGPLCENDVKIFVAQRPASKFEVTFDSEEHRNNCIMVEGTNWCAVKGVQLVDWSKDGNLLLANLVLLEYESDSPVMRVPIIYDVQTGAFSRPDVYKFFEDYYARESKKNCEFDLLIDGFSPDGNLMVSASRPPINPSYDQVFCFEGKEKFLFDLRSNKISPLPSDYKVQRYGTLNAEGASRP
jgi:hypothetical protein